MCVTWLKRPLIFQTINSAGSNSKNMIEQLSVIGEIG